MIFKAGKSFNAVFILKALVLSTLLIVALHLFLQYLNLEVFYQQNGFAYELSNRFDLDDESSLSTWFSQALFLAIALGSALAAYLSSRTAIKRLWQLVAIVGLVFSIDEVASLHEFVLQSIHNLFFRDAAPTSLNNAWLLITPLVLAASGWFIVKVSRLLPKKTMLLFSFAIALFLTGAVFFDALSSLVDRETFLNQGILIGIEEMFELMANVVVVYAIADYIEIMHRSKLQKALTQLK